MSEPIKTRAIVLRKLDYGDTSKIVQLFTEDFGKISAILKGARSPKSKIGAMVDSMNHIQIVIYKKDTREVQLISDVDLQQHYNNIRGDLNRYKYASAIVELLYLLTVEDENHKKLYQGSVRALELLDTLDINPQLIFTKYFLFFIKEIGYQFPIETCSVCNKKIDANQPVSYNFETGILCNECRVDRIRNSELSKELFNLLLCLNSKNNDVRYGENNLDKIIDLLEEFLKYHIHEFKGLKSLNISYIRRKK